jgi:hypothetical protein
VRWPEALGESGTLLEVEDGNLEVRACTFSVAGKPRDGLPVARLRGTRGQTARCRFTRCHARGGSLVALDLAGVSAEVLLDGCLMAGGEPPLLRVHAGARRTVHLRAAASSLVCERTLLAVTGAGSTPEEPVLTWEGWDALLSRSGNHTGGELLRLAAPVDAGWVRWQAHNCLYAGWRKLLTIKRAEKDDEVAGTDLAGWQKRWRLSEGDGVAREPWPDLPAGEPATVPASNFVPAGDVAYASSLAPERALGCDVAALPAWRDGWLALVYEPVIDPPEPLGEGVPPIPTPEEGDRRYHGEELDLTDLDLGAYLHQVQKKYRRKLAPVVVLHLKGSGPRGTTPIRIKGSSLVLYFEPPANKEDAPLALKPAGSSDGSDPGALIEVEGGSLDIIGGQLRGADGFGPRVKGLAWVRGGTLRLFRCKLDGPSSCRSLVRVEGSGETEPEKKTHACTISESVLVAPQGGVQIQGVGARLLVRQSLLVAGTEALRLNPGPRSKGRTNMSCLLENVTFAARQAVLRLGDDPTAGVPPGPVVVLARDCAYLNPFAGKSSKAGMLLYDGLALPRGLLLWQSERDTFDRRLHFGAAAAGKVPDKAEGLTPWKTVLWGTHALRETPRADLVLRGFPPSGWPLERLILPPGRGADLKQLGIGVKKPLGSR